jgi:hypothetical protein
MLTIIVASAGCNATSLGKLEGEIFIVTQGATNVKLGLVEVRVLPYTETQDCIAKTKAQVEQDVAKLQPQLDAARKALASSKARANAFSVARRGAETKANDNYTQDDLDWTKMQEAEDDVMGAFDKERSAWVAVIPP